MSTSDSDPFADTLASPGSRTGPPTLPSGTVLGGTYRIEALIGVGGMGAVYKATHMKLRRSFAVKLLAVDPSLGIDAEAAGRLVQEARTASALDHENIIDVTDLGQTDDGQIYVVMELLEGHDLGDRLEELGGEPMSEQEVRALAGEMLEGLSAAHDAGVVHRDLKPANVFLARKPGGTRVKLVDFGLAKALESEASVQLTQSGQLMGTPLYMSPEQARGEKVDRRSDVYAAGIMLYELLSGEVPFPGTKLYQCVHAHVSKPPPPLAERRPDLPSAVVGLVHQCLEKDPNDRPADARELAEAWRAAWAPAASSASTIARPRTAEPAPSIQRDAAPRRGARVAAAVVTLALGGAGVWAATRDAEPRPANDEAAELQSAPSRTLEPEPGQPTAEPVVTSAVEPNPELDDLPEAPRTIRITSRPTGAEVVEGETTLGQTPLDIDVGAEPRELTLERRGYRPTRVTLDPDGPDEVSATLSRRRASMAEARVPMLAPR